MTEDFDRMVDQVLKYKPSKERNPQQRKLKDTAVQDAKPVKAKQQGK